MSVSTREQQRAKLVSLLWSLKQALAEESGADGTEGAGFVHFNALLRDEGYRREILEKAEHSQSKRTRTLAQQIRSLDMPGSLIGDSTTTQEIPAVLRNLEADTATPVPQRRFGFAPVLAASGLLVAIAAAASVSGMLPFEIDLTGNKSERPGEAVTSAVSEVRVSGSVTGPMRWSTGTTYILEDLVFIESGATLTIEPGVRILGNPGSALIVTRDATINARGTPSAPIVFTSSKPENQRKRGDWGGIVLLGNAPINTGLGHIEGVDKTDPRGAYGGSDRHDSCGILQYVRIEFAGFEISADNELNGLTLGGCGDGTLIRYVQVHMGLDDGIEFFGGTANMSNVVITRPGDDALDWDRGWTGNAQFVVIQQDDGDGDNGIEADNYKKDHYAQPRSAPTLSNITIVGSRSDKIAQRGMTLRRGTCGDLRNILVAGFTKEALDIRDASTAEGIASGCLSFKSVVFALPAEGTPYFTPEQGDEDDDGGFDEGAHFAAATSGVLLGMDNVLTDGAFDLINPNIVPPFNLELMEKSAPLPQGEFWDEAANYIGAERPGNRASWMNGWTAFPNG